MDPKDIIRREYGQKEKEEERPKDISDEHVLVVEEKLTTLQEFANRWQKRFTQNEVAVSVSCFIVGMLYSFAINECTGDFDVPWYAYGLAFTCAVLFSLLLITEGSLPLWVVVKFLLAFFAGHILLMFMVAIDSHAWRMFTFNTCRYPFNGNDIMWWCFGVMCGYLFTNLYKIRR